MWGSSWVGVQLRVSSLFDSVGGDHLCELFKVLVVLLLLLLLLLFCFGSMNRSSNTFDRDVWSIFLIDLETDLTRSN